MNPILMIPKLSDFYLFSNSFVYKALKNHLSKMLSAIIKVYRDLIRRCQESVCPIMSTWCGKEKIGARLSLSVGHRP